MSNPDRKPATEIQLEIVRRANRNPRHLVGQEVDTMRFYGRCGSKLQLDDYDARWVETIGKKMGLIESTPEEKAAFKEDADWVRRNGGRNSNRYRPVWQRKGSSRGGRR